MGNASNNAPFASKPKTPPPPKKDNLVKDAIFHQCGEVGHWRRNCPVYLAELMKKKKLSQGANTAGIFTIELYYFPSKSWIYDTGCGTHICITTQGLRGSKKLKPGALSLYLGVGHRAAVEAIGTYHLELSSGLVIVLNNCHYATSITRGVISVSRLFDDGFIDRFDDNNVISVSKNNLVYFKAVPRDDIYEIDMSCSNTNDSSMYAITNKRAKINLDSFLLWHYRLRHISKKCIEKLRHDGLLNSIDIESLGKCVSCMSGKMARKPYSHQVERAKDLLGLIHTDVCCPFKIVSRQRASYFVTFTDDFSRYGYVYLLKHKHEVFETFKVFQKEVENQLGKIIKSLRSNRRERRNRTLLDMVRSMMSQTTLPKSFWDYALETVTRILNMVPTKKRDTLTKPDKLDPRSFKCIFVGYPKETMGYSFYNPYENKVFVARNAEFFESKLLDLKASRNVEDLELIQEEDTNPYVNTSLNHEEDDQEIDEPQSDINPILELPPNARTVGSKWLFKKNTNMDGAVYIFKARFVAKGFTQTYGVDYEETFSPVADTRVIRILIAIAAHYDYEIWQMHVKTAFLNGHLSKEVYMEQPQGFVNPKYPSRVCKLKRSIYGLKQASRQCQSGYLVYVKRLTLRSLEKILYGKFQRGTIPMQEKLKLSKSQGASTPAEKQHMQNIPYALAVGSIMYAVRCTRPDVAFAQNMTSRFQQNPGEERWIAVKNILKYLRNTKDMFLVYGGPKAFRPSVRGKYSRSFVSCDILQVFEMGFKGVTGHILQPYLAVILTREGHIGLTYECASLHKTKARADQSWESYVDLKDVEEYSALDLMTTSVGNNSIFRSFFEKQKLTGPNFIDWYRQLRLVLSTEDKENYLEHPIPVAPVAPPGQQVPPQALAAHAAWVKGQNEVVVLINTTKERSYLRELALQGLRESKKLKPGALSLYVGDGHRAAVEAIGTYHLELPISKNNLVYFMAVPRDGINEIDMSCSNTNDSSMYAIINKRAKINLDSSLLWHCRLGHISKRRIEKLQHDGLLNSIDIESLGKCVSCMSRKMARKPYSYQVERAKDLLGLIHTDVCGPFKIMSRQGASYFFTFTDHFSCDGYVYLLKHKHEVFETFKVFQKELENQLRKIIKSLRSDRRGEYMSQEFLDHLKEYRIISHRSPPHMPQNNRVSERRNQTLLDMVRSMMSQTTLPKSFWDYALEIDARIINMVLTKKVDKTLYEIWHGQAPKLSYLKVWGCKAFVKRDTVTKPDKLDPRSFKCIFVGYPKETM
uniref:Integrase catalytic domain-containing protein n=1 Tax=Tanacetum cinerariifolium TaxID=118510 RepID=A0A6L2LLE6_TANCI|nr:hypothetical protein [Tanacetum cinerariifolium]